MNEVIAEMITESAELITPYSDKTDDQIINMLAGMPALEYERSRTSAAKHLGIARVNMLDQLVKQERLAMEVSKERDELKHGIEPWEQAINGQELATVIRNTFLKHTILPDGGDIALTLWVIGSYCFNAFRIFPKLCLSSPEKRCGKTTTMEVLGAMTHRTLMASNVSPSTLFRSIECWQPSILIDEGDTFIDGNEELRGIINSGHTRSGASVLRCVGDDHEPKQFSTWAPMAIAMIKTPPDTIKDRSVMITLRRKMAGEQVTRLPIEIAERLTDTRRKCQRWAQDNMTALKGAEPSIPVVGNDRAEDNWWALIAIANQLGGEWSQLARDAMVTTEGSKAEDDDSIGPMILTDIKSIFADKRAGKITSSDLVDALVGLEERPWCEWKKGQPMTPNSLARMLKPYDIRSKNIRGGYGVNKGYELDQFSDSFSRYLNTPPEISATGATTLQPSNHGGYSVAGNNAVALQSATQKKPLHDSLRYKSVTTRGSDECSVVAAKLGNTEGACGTGDKRESFEL